MRDWDVERARRVALLELLLAAHIDSVALPWLPGVQALAARGVVTGASGRNWASYGSAISLPRPEDATLRALLTDPQTSGGLLVACAAEAVPTVLELFADGGFVHAAVVGRMAAGEPCVVVQ